MKLFDRITEKSLKLQLAVVAVLALISVAAVIFCGSSPQTVTQIKTVSQTAKSEQPLLPQPSESGSPDFSLQPAIPGTTPVVVSRRNNEPLNLRAFRNGNVGVVCTQNGSLFTVLRFQKYEKQKFSSFHTFLQHSLPVRAGPAAV